MDASLVAGLLSIAGTTCTGALGLAAVLVKRHLALLTRLESNDDAKTATMAQIAAEMTRTRELQQEQGAEISGLRADLEDKRNSEAIVQSKVATALLDKALGTITGQHAAVTDEAAEAEAPTAPQRRPQRSAPVR